MSPTIPTPSDELHPPALEFASCGWIHGHQIRAAEARGARAYQFRASPEPSEEDGLWRVEEACLGRSEGLDLLAFVCTRKSGLFSTQTEAALAYSKTLPDGSRVLSSCSGIAPDQGGSWIPIIGSTPVGTEGAASALLAIEGLSNQALVDLERAVRALRVAREAELAAKSQALRALATPDASEVQVAALPHSADPSTSLSS